MILHPLVSDKETPSGVDSDIFEAKMHLARISQMNSDFFGKVELRLLHSGRTHLLAIHE